MATDRDVTDAVARVREAIALRKRIGAQVGVGHYEGSDWIPHVLIAEPDVEALLAHLDALTARCEAAEGDVQRLDWAEYAYLEVKRPTPDNGWEVEAFNCSGYAERATLREAIDAARRGEGV